MRIAALDISKNNVGIAFSDEDRIFVAYETTLKTKNYTFFKKQFKECFDLFKPTITYVGSPEIGGKKGQSSLFIKSFVHNLRHIIGKFELVDENFSTFYARQMIEEKNIKMFHSVDSVAARMIVVQKIQEQRLSANPI